MNLQGDADQRRATYQRLMARNRLVAILRVGVPALGVVALVSLLGQIYISSLTSRFGIGQITVSRDSVTVESPQYAGLLEDGSAYRISANDARAATEATDRIGLTDVALNLVRPDGVVMDVSAVAAVLDTTRQRVEIDNRAHISNSLGTSGVIDNSIFDYASQRLRGEGPVTIDYADGTHLVAEGITYDAVNLVWTFTRATVTLPQTPGAKSGQAETDEMSTP